MFMCDMIYSWTSAYVEPHLKLTSQVTPKMSYLYQQSVVTSKTIMKVFPMGLYFVYMPLPLLMILLLVSLFQEGNVKFQNVWLWSPYYPHFFVIPVLRAIIIILANAGIRIDSEYFAGAFGTGVLRFTLWVHNKHWWLWSRYPCYVLVVTSTSLLPPDPLMWGKGSSHTSVDPSACSGDFEKPMKINKG